MTTERVQKMTEAEIARLLSRAPPPPPAADDLASRIVARAVQARRAPKLTARRSLGRLWLALAAAALGGAVAAGAAAQAGYLDLRRVAELPAQILHALGRPPMRARHADAKPARILVSHPGSRLTHATVAPPLVSVAAPPPQWSAHPPRLAVAHPFRAVGPHVAVSHPAGRPHVRLDRQPRPTRRLREIEHVAERPAPLSNVAAAPAPVRPMAEREPGPAERDVDRAVDRRNVDRVSDRRDVDRVADRRDVDLEARPRWGPFAGERRFAPDRPWRRRLADNARRPFKPNGPHPRRRW